jgi:hypothetical protein
MGLLSRLVRLLFSKLRFRIGNKAPDRPPEPHGRVRPAQKSSPPGHASNHPRTAPDLRLAVFYANLEVPYGSDLATVQKGWKQLLKRYHPDLYSNDPKRQQVATKLVQELNHAYEQLEKHLS